MHKGHDNRKQKRSGNGKHLIEEVVQTAEETLYYRRIAETLQLIDLEKEIQKKSESSKVYKSW